MGDRDRYYERGEGRYSRDDSPYRQERGWREWDPREDYARSSQRQQGGMREWDARDPSDDDYRSYGRERSADFGAAQGYRDYGAGYSVDESRRYPGSFGEYEQRGRYGQERGRGYRGESQREGWGERGGSYEPSFGRGYGGGGGYDPSYGRGYGSGYRDRDYGYGNRYSGEEGERGGERDESLGHRLRDAGRQVVRKVKRAFRGPKGYKRSDERIREDVNDRLSEQDEFDPGELEVSVSNGEVTLTGTVDSRHDKFLAEEIADDVSGVSEVHNQIRVRRLQRQQTAASTESTASMSGAQSGAEASRARNARPQ